MGTVQIRITWTLFIFMSHLDARIQVYIFIIFTTLGIAFPVYDRKPDIAAGYRYPGHF